ncbi:hypothetical protein DFA_10852 [Cavenderia fasciculata]|uniref:ATP synthase subunit d, mitochondrial n=1 Tax=Cavenderia fasciculata TaxID=261658 RepID=F4QBK6_CACFS|nr:uncharacterized protein DFA_10852 [Cavenderia fasciculata]EGG14594.1 hypothetical protein DFA_10852 [Cavenderia fasciculata]|eukprot:XP_004351102.1 hypothetical protein DFA_10852 [Cavenderia fasciculata]
MSMFRLSRSALLGSQMIKSTRSYSTATTEAEFLAQVTASKNSNVIKQTKEFLARPDIAPWAARFNVQFKEKSQEEQIKELKVIDAKIDKAGVDAFNTVVSKLNVQDIIDGKI